MKSFKELKDVLKADNKRFNKEETSWETSKINRHFTFWFRVGSYLLYNVNYYNIIFLKIVRIIYSFYSHWYGIQIPLGTQIGGGFRMMHYGGIVISKNTIIGKNCSIHQNVSIGKEFINGRSPVIGDNVVIFPSAVILGDISIGDSAVILANSTVTNDVPSNVIVAGSPARVVRKDAIEVMAHYYEMFNVPFK